jgi:hypothetical protein
MSAEELLLQLFSDALQKTRAKRTKSLVDSKRRGPMSEAPPEDGEMGEDEMKLVLEMESGDEEKEGDELEKRRKSMLG